MSRLIPFLLLTCVTYMFLHASEGSQATKFKAAVYGHRAMLPPNSTHIVSRAEAVTYMKRNINVYGNQANAAKSQGADILVFPEDGLYGFAFTRESIYPYLEFIPDPSSNSWSPCDEPDRYADTEVQKALSCIAKENSLYIVANMGDKQPCNVQEDLRCPPDGRYQFNTDVAFGPNGTLLAKYHKVHLFYEDQYDTPEPEVVYFDTPFGRWGMMTCFDVLFYYPSVPMVLKYNISNIAFPTAWMDALPLLSSLGFHSSFSRAFGVNFLASNIHIPERRFRGSGIYAPEGMKAYLYPTSSTSVPKLLVTELDVLSSPQPNIVIPSSLPRGSIPMAPKMNCQAGCNNFTIFDPSLQENDFYSYLFFDKFTFRTLDTSNGSVKVCQNEVCCQLDYTIHESDFGRELFAFGAFDGLHTYEGQYYFQICALVKCTDARDRSTCGAVTNTSTTTFRRVEIRGQMETFFILPQIVLSNEDGDLRLAEAGSWGFNDSTLATSESFNETVLAAALFGRYYERDRCSADKTCNAQINPAPHNVGCSSYSPVNLCCILFVILVWHGISAAFTYGLQPRTL